MKWSVEKILPVALCIVLPVLNAITTRGIVSFDELNAMVFLRWGAVALMLYALWHLLDFVSARASGKKWPKVLIACVVFLIVIYNLFSLTPFFQQQSLKWLFILKYFIAIIPFLVIQYALRANKQVVQLELEKQQILTENYKVQLEALRSKVDPHFLFNSLNTLRTMVRYKHPNSEQFVMSLSEFYRQTLRYNETSTVTLREELAVLESYLFLMKSRNEQALIIRIDIEESVKDYFIPILALQLVVENCFKHNSMTSTQPLHIQIASAEDYRISVTNGISKKMRIRDETSGYGLKNLKRRYELLGVQNGVTIHNDQTMFSVSLKLV